MKKPNNLLLVLMLTAGLGMPTSRLRAENPDCTPALTACDKAIADLQLTLDAKDLVIADLTKTNLLEAAKYSRVEDELGAWYHNPFVLSSFGFAIGVLGGIWAAKH